MPSPSIPFAEFRKTLLALIYEATRDNLHKYCDISDLVRDTGVPASPGWADRAVDHLEGSGFLKAMRPLSGGPHVQLTGPGIDEAEALFENGWAQRDWQDAGGKGGEAGTTTGAPASNRVVTLDHNSTEYVDAVRTLNLVTEQVRSSNELAVGSPEEHGRGLAELEAGQRVLEAPRLRVAVAVTLIGGVLVWLLQQVAGTALEPAIKLALAALDKLLGTSFWAG
jgi:hypothetical protein